MSVAELRHGPLGTPVALAIGVQDTANRLNQLIRAFNELEGAELLVQWEDIEGKPSVFPADLSNLEVDWSSITDKPSTFPPSAHTHPWSQITAKPETFTPAAHTHPASEIVQPFTTLDVTGSVGVGGSLDVVGGGQFGFGVSADGNITAGGYVQPGATGLNMSSLVGSNPPMFNIPASAGMVDNLDAEKLGGSFYSDYVLATDLLAGVYTIPSFAVDPGVSNQALIADMGGSITGIANGGAGTVFRGGTPSGGSTNMSFGQIDDAHVAAAAAIAPSKINLAAASLADLGTRSAGDLSSGNLAAARLPTGSPTWTLTGLTLDGSLSVRPDVDTTTIFGRARVFSPTSDVAAFAHYDHASSTNYAFRQDSAGGTSFNTVTGAALRFCENNTERLYLLSQKLTFNHTSQTAMGNGDLSLVNGAWIRQRNAAGTTNAPVIRLDTSDIVALGVARTAATSAVAFSATHIARLRDSAGNDMYFPCMTAAW